MDNSNTNTENTLKKLNTPQAFFSMFGLILVLVFVIFFYLFSKKPPTSASSISMEQITSGTLIILFSSLLLSIIAIVIIPNFKQLFVQLSSAFYIVLYTICLILLFALLPSDILAKYAYIITPLTLFLSGLFLFKSLKVDYLSTFSVNYERIKSIIIFVCLIALIITFYTVDPGGFISKYLGYSTVLTMVLAIFSLLYTIVLLTLQDKTTASPPVSLFEKFSKFSFYGSASLVLFLIIATIGIVQFPGGLKNNPIIASSVIILMTLVLILWGILLIVNVFPETIADKSSNVNYMNISKKVMLALFGLTTSGLLIAWIVYNIQSYTGQSSIPSLLLNTLLLIIVLSLAYKTMIVKLPVNNSKKDGFFELIMNIIFYIPCLFTGLFDLVFSGVTKTSDNHNKTSLLIVSAITLVSLAYVGIKLLFTKINLQGGKLLVNNPVYTNESHSLVTHQQLTGGDNFNYQYGLSCWVFVDSAPPNSNQSYIKYTTLLNYGGKPNILYKANTNTLIVTVTNAHPVTINEADEGDSTDVTNDDTEIIDGVSHRVIYKNDNFKLQKWNNIVINYNGGTMDIFLNGELVKSSVEVVPYMTLDTLTIGDKGGVNGGICNVVYFNKPLTRTNLYYLYTMVQNRTPPVTENNNETIIKIENF
jgi:Concanavalin A-like lectin/glucanases superfamily